MLQPNNLEIHGNSGASGQSDRHQDIFKILWKWKWPLVLGTTLGISCGLLQFSRQQPKYVSTALVQVVYPNAESNGLETLDSPDGIRGQSRLDESRIIKSTRVIETAIEVNGLKSNSQFKGMNSAQIGDWILGANRLMVEPVGRDKSTALMEVSFLSTDANLSQSVVEAVIAGYDQYLAAAYDDLGNEVVTVVTQAQKNLQKTYGELAEKHAKFRREAPMIWLGEEARNQFAENSIEVNSSINQVQIQIAKLSATLEHVRKAEREKRPADAILLMLAQEFGMKRASEDPAFSNLEPTQKISDQLPFSSVERRRMLIEMQMKRQELLDSVGEGHPSVAVIQRRIELMESQIATLANSEKQLESERASAGLDAVSSEMTSGERLKLWRESLDEQLASLMRQEALLQQLASDNNRKSKELQDYLTTNNLLNSELASVQTLLDGYTNTLNRIQIVPKSDRRSLETLTPARVGVFAGPSLPPYLFGGFAVGFLSVAGLALTLDFFDRGFRSPDDIRSALGMQILGHIPQMKLNGKQNAELPDASLCTVVGSSAPGSEAFRSIRTSLYFSEATGENRVIQVTSPTPGDGKSTIAANLAVSIAQSGKSVLLIDADMRRPRIAKLLGTNESVGLGDVLCGRVAIGTAIRNTVVPKLSILASRHSFENPAELLSHERFAHLLNQVREEFDYVIVDTPPILAVADACAVASRVDSVLLTIRLRRDTRSNALQASRMLESVGPRIVGVVVNGVSGQGYEYKYSNYGYGYGSGSSNSTPENARFTCDQEELVSQS
jgi:polysaccharide biosynthesis transport protein